jgi:hypothetical protein
VRLVALPTQQTKRTLLGCGIGKVWISEDFASEKTDKEIASLLEGAKNRSQTAGSRLTPAPEH